MLPEIEVEQYLYYKSFLLRGYSCNKNFFEKISDTDIDCVFATSGAESEDCQKSQKRAKPFLWVNNSSNGALHESNFMTENAARNFRILKL
jgi:hypothetical protein